jgi:hypothetical protein
MTSLPSKPTNTTYKQVNTGGLLRERARRFPVRAYLLAFLGKKTSLTRQNVNVHWGNKIQSDPRYKNTTVAISHITGGEELAHVTYMRQIHAGCASHPRIRRKCCAHQPRATRDVTFGPLCNLNTCTCTGRLQQCFNRVPYGGHRLHYPGKKYYSRFNLFQNIKRHFRTPTSDPEDIYAQYIVHRQPIMQLIDN